MIPIEQLILDKGVLETVIENIQAMDKDEYAIARKDGFGASDSSILCGVNLYKNMDALLAEKNNKTLTEEERKVGEKPIVKKGYDLEPLILDKAEEMLEVCLFKPKDMFGFKEVPGLNVNYDGVFEDNEGNLIPVEAKLVSKWGEKYYMPSDKVKNLAKMVNMRIQGTTLEEHIKHKAEAFGIPPYYYTQVQQEIAGLDAPYGYLVAQFDESWETHLYYIKRDDYVISKIMQIAEKNIPKIKKREE